MLPDGVNVFCLRPVVTCVSISLYTRIYGWMDCGGREGCREGGMDGGGRDVGGMDGG